jgi:hypothetical protein
MMDGVEWVVLALDSHKWRAVVNAVMNLQVSLNVYAVAEELTAVQDEISTEQ